MIKRVLVAGIVASIASGGPSARGEDSTLARPIAGDWDLTVQSDALGTLRSSVRLEGDEAAFTGASRPKAVDELLGSAAALARAFFGIGKGGELVLVSDGRVSRAASGDSLTGRLHLAGFPPLRWDARRTGDGFEGALLQDQVHWGRARVARRSGPATAGGHSAVCKRLVEIVESRLYDPRLLQSPMGKRFIETLTSASSVVRDDIELAFTFYAGARALAVSHLALRRNGDAPRSNAKPERPPVHVERLDAETALMRPADFAGGPEEIDAAFERLLKDPPRGLVLDLRGNPGGNLSAMAVAAHLFATEQPAGTFLGATWWRNHVALPRADVDPVVRFASYDVAAFRAALQDAGALAGTVVPRNPVFAGPVAVLVDRRTASACEPLAYLLRSTKRARLIGSATAGAMLSSEEFPIGDGWVLRVPTADYWTADGKRLEANGVGPSEEVGGDKALGRALEYLRAAK